MRKINIESGLNKTVNVNVIIDESGSMSHRAKGVISGVNEYVNDLKNNDNGINYLLNIIKFNTQSSFVIKKLPIKQFSSFSDYKPSGGTALLDAVGDAIHGIDDIDGKDAIFIIITDGEENSSIRYNNKNIKSMIEDGQSKGWVFTYLGADANAWNASADIGINSANTVKWDVNNLNGTLRAASVLTRNYYSTSNANANNLNIYESAGISNFNKLAEDLA